MDIYGAATLILGSFLGFLATLASNNWASRQSRKDKKRSFSQYLRLELAGAIKSLDEIRTAYEHQRFYDFLLLDLLDRNVENLQEARRNTYLINTEKLQEQIFTVINRIAILSKEMRGIQNHAWAHNVTTDPTTNKERPMNEQELKAKETLVRDKVQSNLMEILDLKREVKSVMDELKKVHLQ